MSVDVKICSSTYFSNVRRRTFEVLRVVSNSCRPTFVDMQKSTYTVKKLSFYEPIPLPMPAVDTLPVISPGRDSRWLYKILQYRIHSVFFYVLFNVFLRDSGTYLRGVHPTNLDPSISPLRFPMGRRMPHKVVGV